MKGLPDQVMSCLLDGKGENKTLLDDWVLVTFSPNQGSVEIIDGLLSTFIILLCEQST